MPGVVVRVAVELVERLRPQPRADEDERAARAAHHPERVEVVDRPPLALAHAARHRLGVRPRPSPPGLQAWLLGTFSRGYRAGSRRGVGEHRAAGVDEPLQPGDDRAGSTSGTSGGRSDSGPGPSPPRSAVRLTSRSRGSSAAGVDEDEDRSGTVASVLHELTPRICSTSAPRPAPCTASEVSTNRSHTTTSPRSIAGRITVATCSARSAADSSAAVSGSTDESAASSSATRRPTGESVGSAVSHGDQARARARRRRQQRRVAGRRRRVEALDGDQQTGLVGVAADAAQHPAGARTSRSRVRATPECVVA